MRKSLFALLPLLALGACASSGYERSTSGRYHYGHDDRGRLERSCDRRGGILVPTGRLTGEPSQEYVCDLTNSPSGGFRR